MVHPRVFAYALVVSVTFAPALFLGLVAPRVLGWFFPSVAVLSAQEVWRAPTSGCFKIRNRKLAQGKPLPPIFSATAVGNAYSSDLDLVVERADEHCKIVDEPLPEHPTGVEWERYYRFGISGALPPDVEFVVTGYLTHTRWFGDVRETVPPFVMCAVGKTLQLDGACR